MEMKMTECPKCKSTNVFMKQNGIGWTGGLLVGLGFGMIGPGDWVTYLCTSCGYFENYVTQHDWLTKIQSDPNKVGWKKSQ
jgi:predicted nucleic-acid-binding Zn-ribbon protein